MNLNQVRHSPEGLAREIQSLGITPEEYERLASMIELHECTPNKPYWKHLVARNIPIEDASMISRIMGYSHGSAPGEGQWLTLNIQARTCSIEGVYMCEGSPDEAPTRPWHWCGQSVLFSRKSRNDLYTIIWECQNGFPDEVPVHQNHKVRYTIHIPQ